MHPVPLFTVLMLFVVLYTAIVIVLLRRASGRSTSHHPRHKDLEY